METSIETITEALNDKVEELLINLGIDLSDYVITQDGIKGPCFIHNGDNRTAFSYSKSKGIWSCFTHGCNGTYGAGPIGLIKAIKKLNYNDALDFAIKFLDIKDSKIEKVNSFRLKKKKNYWKEHQEQQEFDLKVIQSMNHGILPDFCSKRKIDIKTIESMGCSVGILNGVCRFIILVKDINGKVVGVSGRKIHNTRGPKWFHCGFKKEINLFGIEILNKNIKKYNNTAILVEGPLDVLKCIELGFNNCVAIFGCSLSDGQIIILNKLGINNIVLALDSDDAGQKGSNKIKSQLENKLFNVEILDLTPYKDFSSMEDNVLTDKIRSIK